MQLIDVFYRIETPKGPNPVYNISVNQISMYWKKVIFLKIDNNHFLYCSLKKKKFYFKQIQTLNLLKLGFIFYHFQTTILLSAINY